MDGQCIYCKLIQSIDNRRFFSDASDSPFVIIDNLRSLTPILVYKEHMSTPISLSATVAAFEEMNRVCVRLFGDTYFLRVDSSKSHFAILCGRVLGMLGKPLSVI